MLTAVGYQLAESAFANLVANLQSVGVSDRELGNAILGALVAVAKHDADYWMPALYAAGVVIGRGSTDGKAN